jgi:hypothetical protein
VGRGIVEERKNDGRKSQSVRRGSFYYVICDFRKKVGEANNTKWWETGKVYISPSSSPAAEAVVPSPRPRVIQLPRCTVHLSTAAIIITSFCCWWWWRRFLIRGGVISRGRRPQAGGGLGQLRDLSERALNLARKPLVVGVQLIYC